MEGAPAIGAPLLYIDYLFYFGIFYNFDIEILKLNEMKTTKIIFVILCAILFAGCGNQQIRKTLNQAESIMDQQPDSALSLLKQIEGNRILSEKQNALYALLYS